jgi:Flp pilus assembly protein TadD
MLAARAALGGAHLQAGRPADAIPHLVAAAPTDEDGSLHYQLSRAYQAAGQSEPAAQALRKSQELRQSSEARQRQMEEEFKITAP